MTRRLSSFLIISGLAVVSFLAGGQWGWRMTDSAQAARPATPGAVVYSCPMHPSYRSDHPGDCPSCGMALQPVRLDGEAATAGSALPEIPGAVRVTAAKQQLLGVRLGEVQPASAAHLSLRVPGRVAIDEQRLFRITAAVDGWIRQLARNPAGSFVRKHQVLATYYTPNLISAAQTYVFALQTNAQSADATIGYQRGSTQLSLQVALDSLRALGMSEVQIQELQQTRLAPTEVRVYSPIDGYVVERNVLPEQRFDKGTELYRISDIGHVWVLAEIFEKDSGFLKPGTKAAVIYQGRRLEARMSDDLPQFDPQTRTFKTRFELDNPGQVLRPDLFVDVELHVEMPAALTVPADAIVDSGLRKVLFVDRGNGYFEPRAIETGWRAGDQVEVTKGVMPGERVVVAGTFLMDSESRMQAAAAAPASTMVVDPVCGMNVDEKKAAAAGRTVARDGHTYAFCSDQCKRDFLAQPEKYGK